MKIAKVLVASCLLFTAVPAFAQSVPVLDAESSVQGLADAFGRDINGVYISRPLSESDHGFYTKILYTASVSMTNLKKPLTGLEKAMYRNSLCSLSFELLKVEESGRLMCDLGGTGGANNRAADTFDLARRGLFSYFSQNCASLFPGYQDRIAHALADPAPCKR